MSLASSLQVGMDAWGSKRLRRHDVHGPNRFQRNPVGNGVSRWRPMDPSMVAGLVRTYEPEELDGTAPGTALPFLPSGGASCGCFSRANQDVLIRFAAQARCHPACRLRPSTRRSTVPLARTPGKGLQETVRRAPGRSSDGGTQANMVGESSASGEPLLKASECPRNRVNPSIRTPRLTWPSRRQTRPARRVRAR